MSELNETADILLIRAMAKATQIGVLNWRQQVGHCYEATIDSCKYLIRWLYWYDDEGITIDRQALIISTCKCLVVSFNGTVSRQESRFLLEAINSEWLEHHRILHERCSSMSAHTDNPTVASLSHPLDDLFVKLLTQFIEAVSNGTMTWEQDVSDDNSFTSTFKGRTISIIFFQPADYQETPLDRLVVRLVIPGATAAFVCGTVGYAYIERMLAQSIPSFRQSILARDAALRTEIAFLQDRVNTRD